MTFGMTLGEHLMMAASANILGVRVIIAQRKISGDSTLTYS